MEIVRLYQVPEHPRGPNLRATVPPRGIERPRLRVAAGQGVVGEAEANRKPGGRILFFSEEIWLRLIDELRVDSADPAVLRCNVLVRGANLGVMGEKAFVLQGIRFRGAGYCEPNPWLDEALWPGARRLLKPWHGGGLCALAMSSGDLVCDADPAPPPESRWLPRP